MYGGLHQKSWTALTLAPQGGPGVGIQELSPGRPKADLFGPDRGICVAQESAYLGTW